jgi:hypothetical protein
MSIGDPVPGVIAAKWRNLALAGTPACASGPLVAARSGPLLEEDQRSQKAPARIEPTDPMKRQVRQRDTPGGIRWARDGRLKNADHLEAGLR